MIPPLLANVYLHYAFDLWVERRRRREARGEMIVVRYADDQIVGFEREDDAHRFQHAMQARLEEFALKLHPDKTRLIEFGRHAAARRSSRGLGKPETFDFLGFTHICGRSRKGRFLLKRITRADRRRAKLKEIDGELRRRMHQPIPISGGMAEAGRHRPLSLLRGAHQQPSARGVPALGERPIAAHAPAAQPEGRLHVGSHGEAGRGLASTTSRPSFLAQCPLRRQTPKVGAQCPNRARWDLSRGRSERSVPTGNALI